MDDLELIEYQRTMLADSFQQNSNRPPTQSERLYLDNTLILVTLMQLAKSIQVLCEIIAPIPEGKEEEGEANDDSDRDID